MPRPTAHCFAVVEFFDYRCGVCKRIHPIVEQLVKSDPNIRRVYKEWPILGPNSVLASRAAIASRKQGKYLAFHQVMMKANSAFGESAQEKVEILSDCGVTIVPTPSAFGETVEKMMAA